MDPIMSIVVGSLITISIVVFGAMSLAKKVARKCAGPEKVIKCKQCGDGIMVTGYIKKTNPIGFVGAGGAILACFGLLFIPVSLGVFISGTSEGFGYNEIPVNLWYGFWAFMFVTNLFNTSKKVPAWVCQNCEYSFVKGGKQ